MNKRSLFLKIQGISEQASQDSGPSYDAYVRLFTIYFEMSFRRKSTKALKFAELFGYDASSRKRVQAGSVR